MKQNELHDYLEKTVWNPFPEFEVAERPSKPTAEEDEYRRRHMLTPDKNCDGRSNLRAKQKEYTQGKYARDEGVRRNRNPYDEGSLSHQLWDEGWEEGVKRRK